MAKETYRKHAPLVALYSSRGSDVNNALLEVVDVLKPSILAPGSSIWAAWSPNSEVDEPIKGIWGTKGQGKVFIVTRAFLFQHGRMKTVFHLAGMQLEWC